MNKRLNLSGLAAAARLLPVRVRHGRPLILVARVLTVLALTQIALHADAGPAPEASVLAGIATWLALTARRDLAPPPGR